jgi:hypothetical protein
VGVMMKIGSLIHTSILKSNFMKSKLEPYQDRLPRPDYPESIARKTAIDISMMIDSLIHTSILKSNFKKQILEPYQDRLPWQARHRTGKRCITVLSVFCVVIEGEKKYGTF